MMRWYLTDTPDILSAMSRFDHGINLCDVFCMPFFLGLSLSISPTHTWGNVYLHPQIIVNHADLECKSRSETHSINMGKQTKHQTKTIIPIPINTHRKRLEIHFNKMEKNIEIHWKIDQITPLEIIEIQSQNQTNHGPWGIFCGIPRTWCLAGWPSSVAWWTPRICRWTWDARSCRRAVAGLPSMPSLLNVVVFFAWDRRMFFCLRIFVGMVMRIFDDVWWFRGWCLGWCLGMMWWFVSSAFGRFGFVSDVSGRCLFNVVWRVFVAVGFHFWDCVLFLLLLCVLDVGVVGGDWGTTIRN